VDIGRAADIDFPADPAPVTRSISSQTLVFIGAMTPALSLDLDALRFGAAFNGVRFAPGSCTLRCGPFWRVMGYGQTSVPARPPELCTVCRCSG
jgi:hypothetical protein